MIASRAPPVSDAGDGAVVVLAATLDTKSDEIAFARAELEQRGLRVLVIDCGVLGQSSIASEIGRDEVARAAGFEIEALRREASREIAIPAMVRGLVAVTRRLQEDGRIAAFLGIGGGTNAALAAAAFEVLPFGVPKVLVSTVASGNTRPFVGFRDVVLFHSVVDILGLNGFLRRVLRQAATVVAGLVEERAARDAAPARGLCIGLTAFGSTTEGATRAHARLSRRSAEVLTFHARGVGGQAMEALVREGAIQAVLDLTTTEAADEVVGGVCSAGPDRFTAAAERGIPQVLLPGAIDMVNFGPRATVPERFRDRLLVSHTPAATLMRTTSGENVAIAAFMAERLNRANGPVGIVLPLRGFSAYDVEGGPFFDPEADDAFRSTLTSLLGPNIVVRILDTHVNDPETIDIATEMLLDMTGSVERRMLA